MRLQALEERGREALRPSGPAFDEAAELFSDMPALWDRAAPEERRRLVAPLIERVYLDIDSKRIGAITPTPEFKTLIDHALEPTADPEVVLIPPESAEEVSSWRSWSLRSDDITSDEGVDPNLSGNADQVNSWRWWRRGRPHLQYPYPLRSWLRMACGVDRVSWVSRGGLPPEDVGLDVSRDAYV